MKEVVLTVVLQVEDHVNLEAVGVTKSLLQYVHSRLRRMPAVSSIGVDLEYCSDGPSRTKESFGLEAILPEQLRKP